MTTLSVNGLHVELDRKTLVSKIDLEVSVGEWICIIGPNGAGKSSLLKALAGIIPSTGEIHIDGSNVRDLQNETGHAGLLTSHKNQSCRLGCGFLITCYLVERRTSKCWQPSLREIWK